MAVTKVLSIEIGKHMPIVLNPSRNGVSLTVIPASLVLTVLTGTFTTTPGVDDAHFTLNGAAAAELGTLEVTFDVDYGAGATTWIEVYNVKTVDPATPAVTGENQGLTTSPIVT